MSEASAWLEDGDGRRWPVGAKCALGRATSNDIIVENGKVSRRHALIHKQDDAEYWMIDLGSGNGTYINGRRIALATRLQHGDTVSLGELKFVFGQSDSAAKRDRTGTFASAQTIIDVRTLPCWLLVADIKGSTALAARLPTTEMAILVGKWMAECKEIVEEHGGSINKYLGDGFLAYAYGSEQSMPDFIGMIMELTDMQRKRQGPPFRLVLHYGLVTVGGGITSGEDNLSGRDVALAFRMEELAGSLGCDVLVSEAAREHLPSSVRLNDVGVHPLQGFENERLRFYAVA